MIRRTRLVRDRLVFRLFSSHDAGKRPRPDPVILVLAALACRCYSLEGDRKPYGKKKARDRRRRKLAKLQRRRLAS